MKLIYGIVHGRIEILKMENSDFFILEWDKKGTKFDWVKTVVDSNRIKRFKPLSTELMIKMITEKK